MLKRIISILSVLSLTVAYSLYQKKSLESNLAHDLKEENILKQLPETKFEDLSKKEFNLKSVLAFNPALVVVHFWGTWCAPCESELPELVNFIKSFGKNSTVKFYLIAVNDDAIKVKQRLESFKGANIVWLLDNLGQYKDVFGSTRVPETYVFSRDGYLLKKFLGPQDWNNEIYNQLFTEYLQISSSKM